MKAIRRLALLVMICTVAVSGLGQSPHLDGLRLKAHGLPNIIFILADDLGYGDLGCYGQKRIKTPNLDRLAADGMRFTQCYAGSPVCAPSRACLMTGQHTGHARIRGNERIPLSAGDTTIAEILKRAGYATGAVGKWGLGNEGTPGTPNRKGFDEWFGYLDQVHAHNYYPEYLWRNEERRPVLGNTGGRKAEYSNDLFTHTAVNFLRMNYQRPFFLYLAYTIPHANNELKEKGMEVPSDSPYSNEPWPQAERNKAAMITRMDRDIGTLLEQLRLLKLEGETVVFFSSDNGPHREGGADPGFFSSSGPFRGIKRDLYEGGIRVPLIARWPGRIPSGSTNRQIVAFWDLLPTLADIARTPAPEKIDGISLLPALIGSKQTNQHEFLYWEFHEGGSQQAVRMGDWKAIRSSPGAPLQLYNLQSDLGETNNVAAAHRDVIDKIELFLKSARTEDPNWPLKPPAVKSTETNSPPAGPSK